MLGTKILTFLLLPLYTSHIPTYEYGFVDVLITLCALITPVVTLQLGNGVFRFLIQCQSEAEKGRVISSAFFTEVIGIVICSLVITIVNSFFKIQYCYLFVAYIALSSISSFFSNVVRGFGKNGVYSIACFISTSVALLSNICLILFFHFGGEAILISLIFSNIVSTIIILITTNICIYLRIRNYSVSQLREVLSYSLALIPSSISWWVTSASDRLIVLHFLGASYNGIYGVANKFPNIFTTVFHVYELAWTEAASRNIDERRNNTFIQSALSKSVEMSMLISIVVLSFIQLFFGVLVADSYADAYLHCYILLLSTFFSAICSLLDGLFTAFKRTNVIAKTTTIGAIVNLIVHISLVNYIGLYAASLSTLVCYIIMALLRLRNLKKLQRIVLFRRRYVLLIIIFIMSSVSYIYKSILLCLAVITCVCGYFGVVNRDIIISINKSLKTRFKKNI